ncbi:MAG: replication-relaxation family protein, partial [Dehalococcoidia bacterium]
NRFMVQLARDARARGWQLAEWHNEAESTCRFSDGAGPAAWIRPDASGVIDAGGERVPFLVEYDRGTLDAGNYRSKFEGYRRYYASVAWRTRFEQEPMLLFVCSDERAARHVSLAARDERSIPLLITTEARSSRHGNNPEGCVGAVWRQQVPGGDLMRWPSVPRPVGADAD